MSEASGEDKDLLPFASGRLVKDYSLLREYWRVARERGREDLVEKAMISEADYKRVREIVYGRGRVGLADLWDIVTGEVEDRIDPDIAEEAAKRLGLNALPSTARRLVARQLAAWIIEAAEHWKFISAREGGRS